MRRVPHCFVATTLALLPTVALANALIPSINAYRDTSAFYFTFLGIVLIESVCLRLAFRRLHLAAVLWRVIVFNAASSLAGLLLTRTDLRPDSMEVWLQAIPFFVLTLGVELPLILLLFRPARVSRRRRVEACIVANILSYAFLILSERPIEAVWIRRLWIADRRILEQWTNPQLLAESTGLIYGTESGPGRPHRLRVFDPRQGRWHALTNCPPIDPQFWDVEGDLVAFRKYRYEDGASGGITVGRLPDFATVAEISVTNLSSSQSTLDLKISPDREKLAVFIPLGGTLYKDISASCDVLVYEIASGLVVGASPRKASRGLCWSPDSRRVLFRSLSHRAMGALALPGDGWKQTYPDKYALYDDAPTYAYDTTAGTVELFGDMDSLQLASEGGQLVSKKGTDALRVLDTATGRTHDVRVGRLGYRDVAVSPDGKLAIVHLTLSNPMGYLGYPTIVDLRDPSRRHCLLEGSDYRLDWTSRGAR